MIVYKEAKILPLWSLSTPCLYVCPSVCLSVLFSVLLTVLLSVVLSICFSVGMSVLLTVRLSFCLSFLFSIFPSFCLSKKKVKKTFALNWKVKFQKIKKQFYNCKMKKSRLKVFRCFFNNIKLIYQWKFIKRSTVIFFFWIELELEECPILFYHHYWRDTKKCRHNSIKTANWTL